MRKNCFAFLNALIILCVSLSFASCSDDDDDNGSKSGNELLIGKWEQSSSIHWTFDGKYLLIEDKDDLMNGERTVYSYDEKSKNLELAGGFIVYKVTALTENELNISSVGKFTRCTQHK